MIWAPALINSSLESPFTVPCVPTGMKTGVWTSPCAVFNIPVRALDFPSRAVTL
jgi:hypothetical protein